MNKIACKTSDNATFMVNNLIKVIWRSAFYWLHRRGGEWGKIRLCIRLIVEVFFELCCSICNRTIPFVYVIVIAHTRKRRIMVAAHKLELLSPIFDIEIVSWIRIPQEKLEILWLSELEIFSER